jgi:hypothetical protein
MQILNTGAGIGTAHVAFFSQFLFSTVHPCGWWSRCHVIVNETGPEHITFGEVYIF